MDYKKTILDFLGARAPQMYTSAQIVYYLEFQGLCASVIYSNLKKMVDSGDVKVEHIKKKVFNNEKYVKFYWVEVKR